WSRRGMSGRSRARRPARPARARRAEWLLRTSSSLSRGSAPPPGAAPLGGPTALHEPFYPLRGGVEGLRPPHSLLSTALRLCRRRAMERKNLWGGFASPNPSTFSAAGRRKTVLLGSRPEGTRPPQTPPRVLGGLRLP